MVAYDGDALDGPGHRASYDLVLDIGGGRRPPGRRDATAAGGVLLSPFIRQRLVMLAARDNGAGGRVRGKVVVTIADPRH